MIVRPVSWLPLSVLVIASSIGVVVWFGILADIVTESIDPSAESPTFGTDFAAFQLAGQRVVSGETDALYAFEPERTQDPTRFRNPPFYALFMVPFAAVGFMPGYLVWTLLGSVCLAAGLLLLGVRYPLAWFAGILLTVAGLLNFFYGQNSFFTFLLLSASYSTLKAHREVVGGSFLGVVSYKPQLLGGFAVWLVVRHRTMWKVTAGVVLALGALGVTSLLLIPDAWPQFVSGVLTTDPDIPNAPIHLTLRHTALLLLPNNHIVALFLYVAAVAGVVTGQIWFLRHVGDDLDFAFAAAVAVSILIAPRGLAYDWLLLAIPLGLVWTRLPGQWRIWLWSTAALVAAILVSISLAKWQLAETGVAVQVAPLVLAAILVVAARTIVRGQPTTVACTNVGSATANPSAREPTRTLDL